MTDTQIDFSSHLNPNIYGQENEMPQQNQQNVNILNNANTNIQTLIEIAMSIDKTKELEFLCDELLKYKEFKTNQIKSIDTDKLSEYDSFISNLQSSLEKLIIETISMKDIPSRNEKLKSLKHWYLTQLNSYNSLSQIKERTSKNGDQLYDPEPPSPPPESPEEIKKHRSLIPGYERPQDKIEEFKRHKLISKPNLELDLNSDHYYFRANRLKQEKEAIFENTMTNFAKSCYTTQSTMKFNKTMYDTSRSGWFHGNNNLGFYDKEIKGGFSYARPDYEYPHLIVDKDVIRSKHREMNEKRIQEEVKDMVNGFGVSRARFKQNVNKNKEMKTIINTYEKILLDLKEKEIKSNFTRKKTQQQINTEEDNDNINNDNNNTNNNDNEPPLKVTNEQVNTNNSTEEKSKVNINNIQYISNQSNTESTLNFMEYINQEKHKEKIITINFKSSKFNKLDILLHGQLRNKYKSDAELEEKIQHANNEDEKAQLQKTKKKASLPSETLSSLRQRNKVFNYRILGSTMNEFNLYERDRHKKYLQPLSGYDPIFVKQFNIKRHYTEDNNGIVNSNSNNNYFLQTFSKFPNDFLKMRKSFSKFNELQFQRSKVFKKGNKKFKVHMKQMSSAVKDSHMMFPEGYLPKQGSNLLKSNLN